jgi:acyl-ACP thioesterase
MFEHVFSVPYYGLDMNGRVKTGLMLQFLQEAAALHADGLGIGVKHLMERDMTWVLRRYRVRVRRYPGHGDLSVRTWFEPRKNLMSIRAFEIRDGAGDAVADAWSAWIVVDLKRGRPTRLDRALPGVYFDSAEPTGDPASDSVSAPEGDWDGEAEFRVRWGELDLNGHANHTAYFDWALECVPDGVRERCSPFELDAEYISSVPRGGALVRTKRFADVPMKYFHAIYAGRGGPDGLAKKSEAARLVTAWRDAAV